MVTSTPTTTAPAPSKAPHPDQVFFLGEPGELTLGVRTHDLSLPAFYARHHSRQTGHGTIWAIAPIQTGLLRDAPRAITSHTDAVVQADIVVLLAGITDTLTVQAASNWEKHLRATLDTLTRHMPATSRIVIGEIPPLENAGTLCKPARIAAGLHGKTLNNRTRSIATDYPNVTVIPFPAELTHSVWRPESEERRYTNTCKIWGKHLATHAPTDSA
jgi:hypothetical protein